jgi:ubiquinone/menaquinone biosynthesis C-methylase UbiE
MKSRTGFDHYFSASYDIKERFISYWHQVDEIIKLRPKKLLEVGVGNGFVSRYLILRGIDVTALDIDYDLKPTITGSILYIPFANKSFDVISCCEVLEHLPYTDFTLALGELFRVSQQHVIISLPDHTPVYRMNIELPRIKPIKILIPHPFPRPKRHEFDGVHHWMIGRTGFPLKKIKSDIISNGFRIAATYRIFEFYGHRFFVLEKL